MIAHQFRMGSMRLGQVAYAPAYPPSGLEWGQGWGRFAPTAPKVVLPRSPEAGGGVGYTSEGTVLSQQEIDEITAAGGGGKPAGQPTGTGTPAAGVAPAEAPGESGKFPLAAAGVAVVAIAASIFA
jgi:hypothetical protein